MKSKLLTLFVTGIIAMLVIPNISAANIKVCGSGCDHTTVQAAVDAASGGDTIDIGSGSSSAAVNISGSKNLTLVGTGVGTEFKGDVTIASTGKIELRGIKFSGNISISGGDVTISNSQITSLSASNAATVTATGNYWGESPKFDDIITKSDTASVKYDPYYTNLSLLGTNVISINQKVTSKTLVLPVEGSTNVTTYDILAEAFDITSNGSYVESINFAIASEKATNEATAADPVISVSSSGVVTALQEGTATVTVTVGGETYTINFTIVCEEVAPVNPPTSAEWYIIGFGVLLIGGIFIGYRTYKKSKELI